MTIVMQSIAVASFQQNLGRVDPTGDRFHLVTIQTCGHSG